MKKLKLFSLIPFLALCYIIKPESTIDLKNQRNIALVLDLTYTDVGSKINFSNISLNSLINSKRTFILTSLSTWQSYILTYKNNDFNEDEWDVYKNGNFLLLAPKEYTASFGDQWGLDISFFKKVDSVKKLESSFFSINKNKLLNHLGLFLFLITTNSKKFINMFEKLMTTKKVYEWNIFLSGHGNEISSANGLKQNIFIKFLNILQNKINTRLLCYSSCHINGKTSDYIYNKDEYSFAILARCLPDAVSFASVKFDYGKVISETQQTDSNNTESINQLAKFIYDAYPEPNNVVLIRYPKTKEFVFQNYPEKIMLNLDSNNTQNDKLDLIVITNPLIQETLKVNSNARIVSGVHGDAWHYIEKIESNMSPSQILDRFTQNSNELSAKKIF